MTITSKYEVGDRVWVFETGMGKFYQGTVVAIQSWDQWGGFRYEVQHNGAESRTINAEEKFVYVNKQDIDTNVFIEETGEQAPANPAV